MGSCGLKLESNRGKVMSLIDVDKICKDCVKKLHCEGNNPWCYCCGEEEVPNEWAANKKRDKERRDRKWD